ncbi:MAG: hypothetical protein LC772_09670 [Chloroflexi bacterium]|nr:hypothetical protein [Chloroflexota bacterium]
MSLAALIRNLRESITQKKSAKVQISTGAVSSVKSFHESQVWSGAVAVERSVAVPAGAPASLSGNFLAGAAGAQAAAPATVAPPGGRVPSSNGSGAPGAHGAAAPTPPSGSQLPFPPAFPDIEGASIRYLADIPREMRERIQQEGMARAFRRLETPLRALNMATSRKGTTYPAEEMRGFLIMWRQALADYIGLLPDDRSVLVYERSVDEAYFVRGRCTIGAHLSVIEPCWRLNGEVVVRGEAQVVQGWVR